MSHPYSPLALALSVALAVPTQAFASRANASAPDPTTMSDEDRLDVAKTLYGEGDTAFQQGDFSEALAKFEEAYNVYAPNFHVFNVNIGLAAYELGDCVKASTAFRRFLDLVPEHPSRAQAQQKLIDIERTGCANVAPEPPPVTDVTPPPVTEDIEDAPVLTRRSDDRDDAIERERRERDAKKQDPLVIAGAVLTAVGGASLVGGAVSIVIANNRANKLADLASPGLSGFPDGSYSDEEVFALDRNQLPANNIATVALFTAGGALTATGIALLIVGVKRKKKQRAALKADSAASRPRERHLAGAGPTLLPGGGGAAATFRF